MTYLPLRMVYDKVLLGKGVSKVTSVASNLVSHVKNSTTVKPTYDPEVKSIVLLHSLLANKESWRVFLRNLHTSLTKVGVTANAYLLDMRYHGYTYEQMLADHPRSLDSYNDVMDYLRSQPNTYTGSNQRDDDVPRSLPSVTVPHTTGNMLVDMALNVDVFLKYNEDLSGCKPILMGHSMGAKTALLHSLVSPLTASSAPVSSFISLDAAPAHYTHTHSSLLSSMLLLDLAQVKSKQHAMSLLAEQIPDVNTRSFALNNLVGTHDTDGPAVQWRTGLLPLLVQEHHVHSFPLSSTLHLRDTHTRRGGLEDDYTGAVLAGDGVDDEVDIYTTNPYPDPCLFVGGLQSSRLTTPAYTQHMASLFPMHTLHMVRGGHFVHQGPDAIKVSDLCATHILEH